jgi:membrane protease subunit (stomatin/prohibitin family)
MALFRRNKEGGLMDVIRCDESDYLIWKWRPSGAANSTKKENAIRYGSSLRVKDGEMAIFVYQTPDGEQQDFIMGPHDQTIKTANFPILTGIVGTAFGGASPFQAEVFFVNLAKNIPIKFGVPYFDVFDPRFLDFSVPVAVRGRILFNITDVQRFIKLNRLREFELNQLVEQIRATLNNSVRSVVSNVPAKKELPVLQLERKLELINTEIRERITPQFDTDFGITLKLLDVEKIDFDKESNGFKELRKVTAEQQEKTISAQTDVNIKNLQDTQEINAKNMDETLRIQREEAQREQKLKTEGQSFSVHQLNQQSDVAKTAAESMGKMGSGGSNGSGGSGGGMMDPGSMMASMAMGGAVGSGMAGMMGNMMQGMNEDKTENTPPPLPQTTYYVAKNGQQLGPFTLDQLKQFVVSKEFEANDLIWKEGMENWLEANQVEDVAKLFSSSGNTPPPIPTK